MTNTNRTSEQNVYAFHRRYSVPSDFWGILDVRTGARHPRPAWTKKELVDAVKWLNAYERRRLS